jgi:hypothetical protein
MAIHLLPSVPQMLPLKRSMAVLVTFRSGNVSRPFRCMATTQIPTPSNITTSTVRRSANYQPPIWHYDYIQSLTSEYVVYVHSISY